MITFVCECGKSLRVKDEAAGKRVRCPACNRVATVPQGAADSNLGATMDESAKGGAAGPAALCPQCHVELPAGAVLCTTCGLDLRTGKKVVGRRSIFERIPWATVRSIGSTVLLLGILAALGYLMIGALSRPPSTSTPAKGETEKESPGPAGAPARRTALPSTYVRVHCVMKAPEPALPEGFVFRGADGDYPVKKLMDLVAARLAREAADALFLEGHKVLRKGDTKPQGEEELTLEVEAHLAWVYQEKDGHREPKAVCSTSCKARLVRSGGVSFWTSKERPPVERADTHASREDLDRVASLKGVRTEVDYDKMADQVASEVAGQALWGIQSAALVAENLVQERAAEAAARQALADLDSGKGDPAKAAQLVTGGNAYAIAGLSKRVEKIKEPAVLAALAAKAPDRDVANRAAQLYVKSVGSGPKASAAISALEQPEKLLLGPLRPLFAKGSGSFAAELPLLDHTGKQFPYLALAFARTAAQVEKDASVKQAYRALCIQLEAKKQPITVDEIKLLGEVANAEPASLLGRTAVLTLLETTGFMAESPAFLYLCRVAANGVPDLAEPWPDGSLRLSDEQMKMLQGVTQHDEKLGEVAAIALLMRVGGEQREEVRKLIKCVPPFDDPILGPLLTDLRSDDTTKFCTVIIHGIPHEHSARSLAPLMADAYYKHNDPTTRATALYGLFLAGGQADPYKWALFKMLESSDTVERRAAAASFARLGGKTAFFIGELRSALSKQTDPQTRHSLESAVSVAAAAIQQMVNFRDRFQK